jgi:lipoate-protein ligase A
MVENLSVDRSVAAAAAGRGWMLEAVRGSAGELHARPVAAERLVRVHLVDRTALVLGSTQDPPSEPLSTAVELARRRSGGGAVWLEPGAQVWVDLVLPRRDRLWVDDVGRSALWLGSVWAEVTGGSVWDGTMQHRAEGMVACFAGLGPGEVHDRGSKVVGISQRRTRELARFQSVAYLHWDPDPLADALECAPPVRERLRNRVSPLAPGGELWGVVERLLANLP